MKKFLGFVCAVLIGACSAVAAAAGSGQVDSTVKPTILLATKGASDYVIVVPDGDDPNKRVSKAANLLQSLLAESLGCKLPIFKEAEAPADKPHIYLGKTRAAQIAGVPVDQLKEWTFCKRVVGKDLFLCGLDAATVANRPDILGTYKAVSSFLEDEVGVRFLLPGGPNGLHVPKLAELRVDAGLNFTSAAKIPYCYGRWYGDISIPLNHVEMSFWKNYGGHSYYDAVPLKTYATTHPEYFRYANGQRQTSSTAGQHLCISNPEVQELMLKEIEKQLDLGFQWVELGQTDGYQPCECEKCKAIAGNDAGEALWIVHRKLAEQLKLRRPGAKVVILSYPPTYQPPKTFKSFPGNVVIEMCSYTPEDFEAWKAFPCERTVYIYNWGAYKPVGYLPRRSPEFAAKQLRLFAANNVKGVYKCGFGECLGLEGPTYYVYSKLLADPSADPQKLADDFYRAAYGKASVPMKLFFDSLHKRLDLRSGDSAIDVLPKVPEEQICFLYSPGLLQLMSDNLKRAFTMDSDPRVQARLRLVQREFLYLKNVVSIFTYYRAYRLSGSMSAFDLLAAEMEQRNAIIDSWFVANEKATTDPKAPKWKAKMEDGFAMFGGNKDDIKRGGQQGSGDLSGPPFTWDMPKMREKLSSPTAAVDAPRLYKAVRLTQPPVLNGVLDETAWKKAAVAELGEISQGTLKDGASFRVAYDAMNVYFAVVCKFADVGQEKFAAFGRDGSCFKQECLELFIDPYGTREKKYHFMLNPVADSSYDARFGFIEDSLDPRFGKSDVTWNGAWEYTASVDKEKQCWTAVVQIPFATLGVPAPQPGVNWTMDVAREHYYPNKDTGKKVQELSSWAPNLEERGFGKLSGFGTLEFE
jgi:hypothetical protein